MTDTSLQYFGKVEDGQLKIVHRARFDSDLKLFEGKEVAIVVKKKRKVRSSPLNRYYWGVMVKMIMDGLKELGMTTRLAEHDEWMKEIIDAIGKETTHQFLKSRFIESIKIDEETGEVVKNEMSTKKMTNVEFVEYMQPIYDWARDFLGITIPLPDENFETGQTF